MQNYKGFASLSFILLSFCTV